MVTNKYVKNKYYFLIIFSCFTLLLFLNCKEGNTEQSKFFAGLSVTNQEYVVTVTMEGKTHHIQRNHLEPLKKPLFTKDSIQLIFWEDGNPLKLNFNLFNTDILEKGSAIYSAPDVNAVKQTVDLNFYNAERNVKTSTKKRVIFKKGTINITKINDKELQMIFEGEGSGMMEYGANFPISGQINVSF